MNKKKKSTDSILKDIFDSLAGPDAPAESHPLNRMVDEEPKPVATDFLIETSLPKSPAPDVTPEPPSFPSPVRLTESGSWAPAGVAALLAAIAMLGLFSLWSVQQNADARRLQAILEVRRKQLAVFERQAASGARETDNLSRLASAAARDRQAYATSVDFLKASSTVSSPRVGALLDGLAEIERRQVWFESLTLKDKKATLRGYALDTVFLYKFINTLNASPYFRNARVVTTEELSDNARRFYGFEVEAVVNDSD